ncbi:MAG: AAA family ATPase [bacterium]
MKKFPIGIQTFEKIIKGDYLYIDKTKPIYDVINSGTTFFISRPRRFGKSLLCSILEEIFKGNKELFKNLWIYNSDYKWPSHPVIRIDMSRIRCRNAEDFEKRLLNKMKEIANENEIESPDDFLPDELLALIIKKLAKKNTVAVIVDEYDKPLLDHITDIKVAEEIRDVLRGFYGQLKSLDEHLKFVFLTGVTKFSKTSVFSGLNNLKDLTFDERAADLFGYTQKELEFYFKDSIKKMAAKQQTSATQALLMLKTWYNGYRFSKKKEKVYNPYSILLSLDALDFKNYWFETGTPTFLIELIKKQNYKIKELESVDVGPIELGSFDIEALYPLTVFYQTGYLTIADYIEKTGNYRLSYPNLEIKNSFLQLLIKGSTNYREADIRNYYADLYAALEEKNVESFVNTMKIFYANIPYTVQDKQKEQNYQLLFYAMLKLLGFTIVVEEPTNIGRIDAVIKIKNYIYVFEFKVDQDAKKALNQIENKKYYEKYKEQDKILIAVGINFDSKAKNITDFKIKEL